MVLNFKWESSEYVVLNFKWESSEYAVLNFKWESSKYLNLSRNPHSEYAVFNF